MKNVPLLKWVTLDQQLHGLATDLIIDRSIAARLGLTVNQIDNTLFDAFGERQVSTIYAAQNQYHVVMEVAPKFRQYPETLDQIYTGRALRGAISIRLQSLSTLPSAGVGAVLALIITETDFSIVALIGLILLIGIVKRTRS